MSYKPRSKPIKLQILEYLNSRMKLPPDDQQHLANLRRGYEGEKMFDSWTEKLQCECFVLNDLLLKFNGNHFQIDTLLLTSKTIFFYEVKNQEGDYYFEDDGDKFFKCPRYEVTNPLHQVSRSESLLLQLLREQRINLPMEGQLVFINPEFTLYQAALRQPIIRASQMRRYFKELNATPSGLTKKHQAWADRLISLHHEESPYTQLPTFEYRQLQKGIPCLACKSLSTFVDGTRLVCKKCGNKEVVEGAVMRAVEEFRMLFPREKVTNNIIHDWCLVVGSKKRIRNILGKNFTKNGIKRWTYYE